MCQDRSNEALMHLQKARRLQTTVIANPSSALLLCFTRSADNNPCAPQDRCPLAPLKMKSAWRNDVFDFSKIRNRVSLITNKEWGGDK
ncbi:hypothetical protein CDAR_111081 [Caerostris darwini]|uniref:Uncharacterized protein n=1 Tax=Caerostris darwini TaxID=1538125 RepID=A0AAV4STW3_9ARAC|nr:hypothetical protein CDAR_111081 [Caerostris darwini]